MINYEKLKLAHELADKIRLAKLHHLHSEHDGDEYYLYLPSFEQEKGGHFIDIDDLITKLKKLTEQQTKYKVGQEVWFIDYDEPEFVLHNLIIVDINKYNGEIIYLFNGGWEIYEKYLYPSRQALIEAQITYWKNLLSEKLETSISPCQHECDGKFHERCPAIRKCKKCNEFYPLFDKCQHESDGKMYGVMEWGSSATLKCKKCGEYYR